MKDYIQYFVLSKELTSSHLLVPLRKSKILPNEIGENAKYAEARHAKLGENGTLHAD